MDLNRYTPVPPISSSDVADSNIDTELEEKMELWRQRMQSLNEKENYNDLVSDGNMHSSESVIFAYLFVFHIHSFIHQGRRLAVGSLSTCLSAYHQ